MVAFGALGTVRTLVLSLRLDDSGLVRGVNRSLIGLNAVQRGMTGVGSDAAALQTQLAITGAALTLVGVAAGSAFAKFEREATLGAIAEGVEGVEGRFAALREESIALSREFRVLPQDTIKLLRQVEELGLPSGFPRARDEITRAAIQLGILGDVAEDEAAKGLFRLIRLTSTSADEFGRMLENSEATAGAIVRVATGTAAGVSGLEKFLRTFGQAAISARFTQGEIIALGGTFADLDENMRELATSAIIRLFGKVLPQNAQLFARFLGISVEEFENLRVNKPVELLQRLAEAFLRTKEETGDVAKVSAELGLVNVRDFRIIAALIAQRDQFNRLLVITNDALGNEEELHKRTQFVLSGLQGRIDGFIAAIQRAAIAVGTGLNPVLSALTGLLEGLAGVLERNPILAQVLGVGAFAVGLNSLRRFFGTLGGIGGLASFVGAGGLLRAFRGGRLAALTTRNRTLFGTAATRAGIVGGPIGSAVGLGGGLLGSLLGRGLGPGVVRGLAAGAGGRLALAGTGIGAIVGLFTLLAPVFGALARNLSEVGQAATPLNIVLKTLALLLRGLEIIGLAIGKAFDFVFGLIGGAIGAVIGEKNIVGINQFLEGANRDAEGIAAGLRGPVAPTVDASVTVNVGDDGSGTAARAAQSIANTNAWFVRSSPFIQQARGVT